MNQVNYKLRISKGGIEVEVGGDKIFVEKNFQDLVEKYLENVDKKNDIKITSNQPLITLYDFVKQKSPKKTAGELIPVLIYYAKYYKGINAFTEADLKSLYRDYDTSVKRPTNMYQAIQDCARTKGFIAKVKGEKGKFKITEKGESFVDVTLSTKDNINS